MKSAKKSMPVRRGAAAMAAYHWPEGWLAAQPVAGVRMTVTTSPSAADVTVASPTLNVIVP